MPSYEIRDKVFFITGGARGLGKEIAKGVLAKGSKVKSGTLCVTNSTIQIQMFFLFFFVIFFHGFFLLKGSLERINKHAEFHDKSY